MSSLRKLLHAGVTAALYAGLTILFAPISFGPIQARVSEALFVLPCFSSAAVPGLFVGCFLSSLLTGAPVYDTLFGSLATLIAAYLTFRMHKRALSVWLLPLPTVISNGVLVGLVLKYVYLNALPLYALMLYVAAGEALVCYALGLPLKKLLNRVSDKIS